MLNLKIWTDLRAYCRGTVVENWVFTRTLVDEFISLRRRAYVVRRIANTRRFVQFRPRMKKLALLTLVLFSVPLATAQNPQPMVRQFSRNVDGYVGVDLATTIIDTDGWKVLSIVPGTAWARAQYHASFIDAKLVDDHHILMSYSFGGLLHQHYVGGVGSPLLP